MKWAPIVIVIYMLAALCWWTYLLYSKNDIIYRQQIQLIAESDLQDSAELAEIKETFQTQKAMIIGEGIVFTLALIAGVFYLWVGYKRNLQNAERQKNFLLSVTHELKSPMASIKLAFETIKRRNLSEDQNNKISANGIVEVDRLHKQVENILTATSIERRYFVQRSEATLESLLDEIVKSRQYTPQKDRTKYSISGGHSSDAFSVDIGGVLQISENLLENALKYSEDEVLLELSKSPNILKIEVRDYGPGIPSEERSNIFSRFYRIGNEETRNSKGTGLGLFIVKHIAEKNNGRIYVKENHPKGSIFTVEIKIT